MKAKHTLVAFLVLAGLAAYVFMFERGDRWEEGQVHNLPTKDATRVEVTTADGSMVIEKRGDEWYLTSPGKGLAREDDVERMVEAVGKFTPKGKREGEDLSDVAYGLTDPAVKAKVSYGSKSSELWIGEEAVAGEFYARVPGDDSLYFIEAIKKTDLEKKAEDLREKQIAKFEVADARKVQLSFDGDTVVLENDPEPAEEEDLPPTSRWRLTRPITAKADKFAAENVTRKISNLRAEEFVDDPPATSGAEGDDFGFGDPQMTATVSLEEGKDITVLLGKTIERAAEEEDDDDGWDDPAVDEDEEEKEPDRFVYVRRQGRDETFLVKADVLDDLRKSPSDLRDKKLTDFVVGDVTAFTLKRRDGASFAGEKSDDAWQVRALGGAKSAEADNFRTESLFYDIQDLRAEDFVDDADFSNLALYGLDDPAITIELTVDDDRQRNGKKQTIVVHVGNRIVVEPDGEAEDAAVDGDEEPEPEARYYVRLGDEQLIVLVDAADIEELHGELADFEKEPTSGSPDDGFDFGSGGEFTLPE